MGFLITCAFLFFEGVKLLPYLWLLRDYPPLRQSCMARLGTWTFFNEVLVFTLMREAEGYCFLKLNVRVSEVSSSEIIEFQITLPSCITGDTRCSPSLTRPSTERCTRCSEFCALQQINRLRNKRRNVTQLLPLPLQTSARWQPLSPGSLQNSTTSRHVVSGVMGTSVTACSPSLRYTVKIIWKRNKNSQEETDTGERRWSFHGHICE